MSNPICEVKLAICDGVFTKYRTVAYVKAEPIIIAANLFNRYVISNIDDAIVFDPCNSTIRYSICIERYCGPLVPLASIKSLYYNSEVDKARVTDKTAKEYATILNSVLDPKCTEDIHELMSLVSFLADMDINKTEAKSALPTGNVADFVSDSMQKIQMKYGQSREAIFGGMMLFTSILENNDCA